VHRDLKPANVLVLEGSPLRLKLLDFGVAKLTTSGPTQTRAGQVLGTATHMAPEQALGDPSRVTGQSDLYSLGVIAYEMLTGRPVFHHESDVMLMVMHVRDPVPPIRDHAPEVPEGLARLIEQCLAKNPADRPPSARHLAELLADAVAGRDIPPPTPATVVGQRTHAALADQPTRVASAPPPAAVPARPEVTPRPAADQPTRIASEPAPPIVQAAAAATRRAVALAAAEATHPAVALDKAPAEAALRPAPALPVIEQTTRVTPHAPVIEPVVARPVTPAPAPIATRSATPAPAPIAARAATPAPVAVEPARPPAAAAFVATRPVPYAPVGAAVPAPAITNAQPSAEATVQTLLSRLQRRGDFPAFARTVGEVSHKADANGTFSAGQLGETILKDYALTSKLLRIVNATYARRFGGKIYSIQHAIVILGFDRVRSLALSISLFKTQGTGKGNERVSESAISALVSSEIGRHLAAASRVNDDEATVCAMFKNLGRHLVLVYLPELYDQIEAQVASGSTTVSAASKRVLGATFEELGTAIAKAWQLPEHVVGAIGTTGVPDGELERPGDRLNALARFANELCDIVTRETPETRERAIKRLLAGYKNLIGINGEALAEMLTHIEESLSERYAALLGGDLKSSRFVMNVSGAPPAAPGHAPELVDGHAAPRARPVASFFASAAKPREQRLELGRQLPAGATEGTSAPLEQRIAELRVSADRGMPADTVLTEALRLVAEHTRARSPLVLTATANKQHLVVRFGLRDDLDGLKRELKFPLRLTGGRPQIFANAYHAGKDCVVKDCFSQESSETLPSSYYEVLGSAAFALFACLGKGVTPALLLLEAENPAALPTPARMAALAELRPLIARAAART